MQQYIGPSTGCLSLSSSKTTSQLQPNFILLHTKAEKHSRKTNKPCAPQDPKGIVNEAENDPRQDEKNERKACGSFSSTILGHFPHFKKHITCIVKCKNNRTNTREAAYVREDDKNESCDMMTHRNSEIRTPRLPENQSKDGVCIEASHKHIQKLQL